MNMAFTAPIHTSKPLTTEVSEVEIRQPYYSRLEFGRLLVAFQRVDHTYHLAACCLPGNAGDKMIGLKDWRFENLGRWHTVATFLLCKKPYIAVGKLGPSSDLEAQALHETQFEDLTRNETLTRGYARPSSLVDSADMFDRVLPSFRERPEDGVSTSCERHVLVVALEVDRSQMSLFILMMALVGFAVGASISIIKRDLGLGAEIGGAVFSLVTVLQGMIFLMYR